MRSDLYHTVSWTLIEWIVENLQRKKEYAPKVLGNKLQYVIFKWSALKERSELFISTQGRMISHNLPTFADEVLKFENYKII